MSSTLRNAYYKAQGTLIKLDGEVLNGVTSVSPFGTGSINEINTTSLSSSAVETVSGLTDGGTISVQGIANPQSTVFTNLDAKNKNGQAVSGIIAIGGIGTNSGVTDGSSFDVQTITSTNFTDAVSGTPSTWKVTITNKAILDNVVEGDYIEAGSNSYKITGITENSSAVILDTAQTTDVSVTGSIKIVRPAVKWEFVSRVANFSLNAGVDDKIMFDLSLRVTGETTNTLGTPSVTL